jgi:hypothetical protein
LHIECLQDKMEDAERQARVNDREREARKLQEEGEAVREAKRYRELLEIRESEVDRLKLEAASKT